MRCSCLGGHPHISVCTSVLSAFSGVAQTSILFGLVVYSGHVIEMPNDCPKGSTCSSKRTCKLALEGLDLNLGSVISQLCDSLQEPLSLELRFLLVESCQHLPQSLVTRINSHDVEVFFFFQIYEIQVWHDYHHPQITSSVYTVFNNVWLSSLLYLISQLMKSALGWLRERQKKSCLIFAPPVLLQESTSTSQAPNIHVLNGRRKNEQKHPRKGLTIPLWKTENVTLISTPISGQPEGLAAPQT